MENIFSLSRLHLFALFLFGDDSAWPYARHIKEGTQQIDDK